MKVVIRPEAIDELLASARWYEERRPGLGSELIDEGWATVERIKATPEAFGQYDYYRGSEQIRRAGLARFPISAIFLVEPENIAVLAFAPDKRRPLYWLDRLRDI